MPRGRKNLHRKTFGVRSSNKFLINFTSTKLLSDKLINFILAASYGDGNYFAVNSSYSVGYARSNARGEKLMYMAKVLVGEYTQGQHGMKAPPKKGTGTDLYDSVVNTVANPSMFIVFPDNHAYPEYLICFR